MVSGEDLINLTVTVTGQRVWSLPLSKSARQSAENHESTFNFSPELRDSQRSSRIDFVQIAA